MTTRTHRAPPLLTVAVALTALLPLAACRRAPAAVGWSQLDLWHLPPRFEQMPPAGGEAPLLAVTTFQGGREVRDLRRVFKVDLVMIPHLGAARVHALRQTPGTRVSWELQLADDPYLSFTPLPRDAPCAAGLEVSVTPAGGAPQTLYREPAPMRVRPSAPVATVDLAPWAGKRVSLALAVTPPRGLPQRRAASSSGAARPSTRVSAARCRRCATPGGPTSC